MATATATATYTMLFLEKRHTSSGFPSGIFPCLHRSSREKIVKRSRGCFLFCETREIFPNLEMSVTSLLADKLPPLLVPCSILLPQISGAQSAGNRFSRQLLDRQELEVVTSLYYISKRTRQVNQEVNRCETKDGAPCASHVRLLSGPYRKDSSPSAVVPLFGINPLLVVR